MKKLILTSLILITTINADSLNLEKTLIERDINFELKTQEMAQEYINSQKMSKDDIKYPLHLKIKELEKNIKDEIKNYGFSGGHKKGEYYAISKKCLFNSLCYGASIQSSKLAPKIIFRIK